MISFFKNLYATILIRIKSSIIILLNLFRSNHFSDQSELVKKTLFVMGIPFDSKKIYVLDFYGTGDSFLFYSYINQFVKLRKKKLMT